jgi:hypothetical protein
MRVLIDARAVPGQTDFSTIRRMAGEYGELFPRVREVGVLVRREQMAAYGAARRFAALVERAGVAVQVFRDPAAAQKWAWPGGSTPRAV